VGGAVTHPDKNLFNDVALGVDAVTGGYVIDFSGGAPDADNALENIAFKTGNTTRPALDLTYMLTDRVGLEATFRAASRHDVRARYVGEKDAHTNDFEEFADAELNPGGSNLFEYRQQPSVAAGFVVYPRGGQAARFQPYFGAGINYTHSRVKLHGDYADYLAYLREDELKGLKESGWSDDEIAEERKELEADDQGHVDELHRAVRNRYSKVGANVKIGADFNLTDSFLLNTQVRYTRMESNLGYWNYMVGVGVKF